MTDKKPPGYWQEWENVDAALDEVTESLGHFPSAGELGKRGLSGLSKAIYKYYGGMQAVRERKGCPNLKPVRPHGFWKEWDNVSELLDELIEKYGHFPSPKEMRKGGCSAMIGAIRNLHGGVVAVRERKGFKPTRRDNYWNKDTVLAEVRQVMQEHGLNRVPGVKKLRELGVGSFEYAILKHFGSFRALRKVLGEESGRKPKDYWRDRKNILVEVQKVMEEHGFTELPSETVLRKIGHSGIGNAIQLHHGGFRKFRRLLGEELKTVKSGQWKDPEYAVQQARKLLKEHELPTLPALDEMKKLRYGGLARAISRHHGGWHKFRTLLGEELTIGEYGKWKDFDYLAAQIRKLMKERNLSRLPTQKEFTEFGYSTINAVIQKYHGGKQAVHNKMGFLTRSQRIAQYESQERAMQKAQEIMQEHGFDVLPGVNKLRKLGYTEFCTAIVKYHSGLPKLRELLGQPQVKTPTGMWKDLDFTIEQARKMMDEHNLDYFPPEPECRSIGYGALAAAIIRYHGGLNKFREILRDRQNVPSEKEQLEGLLEAYIEQ